MAVQEPSLEFERELFGRGFRAVIGVDEVGRGAIAGPVAVGVHVLLPHQEGFPAGLRDSKLLSEKRREELFPAVCEWGVGAVGMASASEIDRFGISRGLSRAAVRALAELFVVAPAVPWADALLLVDGKTDWVSAGLRELLLAGDGAGLSELLPSVSPDAVAALRQAASALLAPGRTATRVKGDRDCAVVAAASIRAKVTRDRLLLRLAERYPGYAWESNKGYGAKAHYAGIRELGVTCYHRKTWLRDAASGGE